MKKILSLILGLLWAVPVLAQENYLSALSLSGTFVTGAEKPYKIPVRVSNGETSQTGYIYADAPVYKLSNYADVVDFQTGKITRNIKKDVFTGAEAWGYSGYAPGKLFIFNNDAKKELVLGASNYYQFVNNISTDMPDKSFSIQGYSTTQNGIFLNDKSYTSAAAWKAHLTELYNAGQPLEIYVVTNTPTVEEINLSSLPQMSGNVTYQVIFPEPQITIATTKYNETKFSPLNAALANAISVVDSVVSNTITQAGRIATLQAQKQTRPNDIADDSEKCPAGKKCLLVEDASGTPHWYEIVENAWSTDYTKLQYISSSGTQWIDTGYVLQSDDITFEWTAIDRADGNSSLFGSEVSSTPQYSVILYGSKASRALYIARSSAMNVGYASNDSNFHSWVLSVTSDHKVTLSKDGVRVGGGDWIGDIQKQKSIGIFENNHQRQIASLTLKSFSITDGGVLVRNMIPMKRKIDDAVGLYDTVNNRFYTNAGTGEFIPGDPVSE